MMYSLKAHSIIPRLIPQRNQFRLIGQSKRCRLELCNSQGTNNWTFVLLTFQYYKYWKVKRIILCPRVLCFPASKCFWVVIVAPLPSRVGSTSKLRYFSLPPILCIEIEYNVSDVHVGHSIPVDPRCGQLCGMEFFVIYFWCKIFSKK